MALQICEIKDHVAPGSFHHQLKLSSFLNFPHDTLSWLFTISEAELVNCPTNVENRAPGPAVEQGGNGWIFVYLILQGTAWQGHFYHRLQLCISALKTLSALHTVRANE